MPWTAGDCYWAQGVNEPRPHLRVVVTKPDLSERFIVVNMTSMRAGADQTTVLKPGDHQLVRHESFVLYGASRMMTVTALEKEIQQGLAVRAAPSFSGLTLKRKGSKLAFSTPNLLRQRFKENSKPRRLSFGFELRTLKVT